MTWIEAEVMAPALHVSHPVNEPVSERLGNGTWKLTLPQKKKGRSRVLLPLFGFKGRMVRIVEIRNRPGRDWSPPGRQRRPGQAPGPLAWRWPGT